MRQDAREQARHISEVTKAYAEGKTVRARPKNTKTWLPFENFPEWNFEEVEYEVKPEQRKPLRGVMWKHPNLPSLCAQHGRSSDHVAELNGWELVKVMEVLPETETEL